MNADTDTRYVYDRNRPCRTPAKSYPPQCSASASAREAEGPERAPGGPVCGPCTDPDGLPQVRTVSGRMFWRMAEIKATDAARRYDTQPVDCDGGAL